MAAVAERVVGTAPGHAHQGPTEVRAFELRAGDLAIEVWTLGATLVRVDVPDRDGVVSNVILPGGDLAERCDPRDRRGYPGVTVGRYANRIRDGRFTLEGRSYQLATNGGPNHLHGGDVGFDQYVWDGEATVGADAAAATFRRTSPDGEEGYPGALDVRVTYVLEPDALTIEYEARTDRPTIAGLTNHAYWNLAGGGTVEDHVLTVRAQRYLPVDATQIPVGGPARVAGTRFDLRRPSPLGTHVDGDGIDHCYLLDHAPDVPDAELVDPAGGRFLRLTTDQPAVQVYTADHLGRPRRAVCLETQVPPDAPNQPALGDAVLRPGEVYRHRSRHELGARGG